MRDWSKPLSELLYTAVFATNLIKKPIADFAFEEQVQISALHTTVVTAVAPSKVFQLQRALYYIYI